MNAPPIRPPCIDASAEARLAAAPAPRKALFLDRDGVINVDHGYVHDPQRTEWVPGIFALAAEAHARGYLLIVATNQAGIARGYYDEAAFLGYTAWMHGEFAARGTPLLATYWCPHHAESGIGDYRVACACRKPKPGMLLAAIERFGIDPDASLMIGDKPSDLAAAAAAGVRGRLLGEDAWGDGLQRLLEVGA